jgi:hypothetical protein
MADFLAKLAGRTLSTEPSPRPVIAPMFAAGPMMAGESMSETIPQDGPADDSLSSLMPRSARPGQPGLTTRPEGPDDVAPGRREFIALRLSGLAGRQPAVANQQSGPGLVPRKAAGEETRDIANQQIEPGSVAPRTQVEFSPVKELPSLIGTPTSISPDQPGARLDNARREPQQASAPAPVIKVSIGRIDVRAVTPPASTTPQKASPARTQPSLEEYLQARNRGKR